MPRNSQSPPSAVDRTSSLAGLGAELVRHAPAGDHVIGQPAEALDLDLDQVAGLDRPGVRRGPDSSTSPGAA